MESQSAHRPRKRFGQNFLHDQRVIENIIAAFEADPEKDIIEIGPGKGALTVPLLEKYGRLQVVEIDTDLAELLSARCSALGDLTVHTGDALKLDLSTLTRTQVQVIGNLPYNISTPLIFHLLSTLADGTVMLFLLQKEVVDRICAGANDNDYGRLSVMVQAQCRAEKLFEVPASAFNPPPKVTSAIVRMEIDSSRSSSITDLGRFELVVRQAFSQRRKTLRNSLKNLLNEAELLDLGIEPGQRAENIDVGQYVAMANYLARA